MKTMDAREKQSKPVNVKVNAGTIVGSVYSQVVSVTVTDVDLTLEFVYINPRIKNEGQVVARVTLPLSAGENLAKAIAQIIMQHKAKKKGIN